MHAGMLADIQRVQVEAEFAHLAQERTEIGVCQPFPAIGPEAAVNEQKIVLKFRGVGVGGGGIDGLAGPLQLVKHIGEEAPIALNLIVWSPRQVHAGNGLLVMLEPA